jgi:hypothetical protein
MLWWFLIFYINFIFLIIIYIMYSELFIMIYLINYYLFDFLCLLFIFILLLFENKILILIFKIIINIYFLKFFVNIKYYFPKFLVNIYIYPKIQNYFFFPINIPWNYIGKLSRKLFLEIIFQNYSPKFLSKIDVPRLQCFKFISRNNFQKLFCKINFDLFCSKP